MRHDAHHKNVNPVTVIASEAKQSKVNQEAWIASSPSAPRNDGANSRAGFIPAVSHTIERRLSG
jgi:hypothetical protein